MKYYAIKVGRETGIYTSLDEAESAGKKKLQHIEMQYRRLLQKDLP